jgi:hypothetical protein
MHFGLVLQCSQIGNEKFHFSYFLKNLNLIYLSFQAQPKLLIKEFFYLQMKIIQTQVIEIFETKHFSERKIYQN